MKYGLALLLYLLHSVLAAQNFDIDLAKQINKNETAFKNKYLELNASSVSALSIGLPAVITVTGILKHDKQLQRDGIFMGGALIVNGLITFTTKRIINRQRPFEKYSFIIKRDDERSGLSFPSGHTSAAFCTATSVALRYRKWYFVVPSYVFATSVAWARVYQGVHYPTDVLGGALIGAGSAWLSWKVQKLIEKRYIK